MSPKKGDPVAPPTVGAEWRIRFATNDAIKGWHDLEKYFVSDKDVVIGIAASGARNRRYLS